jgi:hypothetical protein
MLPKVAAVDALMMSAVCAHKSINEISAWENNFLRAQVHLFKPASVCVCARVVLLKYNDGNYVVGTRELYISKRGKYQLRECPLARACVSAHVI